MNDTRNQQIREVLRGLRTVIARFRLYGATHPETIRFADELVGTMAPLLTSMGQLRLSIGADHITVDGQHVLQDDDSSSFVEQLYHEGIQDLILLDGLQRGEVLELVRLLSLNLDLPEYQEQTLSGLLWQSDLPHIQHHVVEGVMEASDQSAAAVRVRDDQTQALLETLRSTATHDESLAGLVASVLTGGASRSTGLETPSGSAREASLGGWAVDPSMSQGVWVGQEFSAAGRGDVRERSATGSQRVVTTDERDMELDDASTDHESIADDAVAGQEVHDHDERWLDPSRYSTALRAATAMAGVRDGSAGDSPGHSATQHTLGWADDEDQAVDLPPEQIAQLWDEIESISFDTLLDNVLQTCILMLARRQPGISIERARRLCSRGLHSALDLGHHRGFLTGIDLLTRLAEQAEVPELAEVMRELLGEFHGDDVLLTLNNGMELTGGGAEMLVAFIRRGGPERVIAVRDSLHLVDPHRADHIGRILLLSVAETPTMLGEGIGQLSPAQLVALYNCLSLPGLPLLDHLVDRGLHHREAAVRRHVLSLIVARHDAPPWRLVAPLFHDRQSDLRVAALRAIQVTYDAQLAAELHPELSPQRFKAREPDEMMLLARLFGTAGGKGAIPALQAILDADRLSLMLGVDQPEIEAALWGIVSTGSPEARKIVTAASRSMRGGLKRPARRIVEQLRWDRD